MTSPVNVRAALIAGLADPSMRIELPAPVAAAVRVWEHSHAIPVPPVPRPGSLVAEAIAAQGAAQAAAALKSRDNTPDPGTAQAVAEARAAEQAAADQRALVVAVRDAAEQQLASVSYGQQAAIITALRARHRQVITELIECAGRLPVADLTDAQVLRLDAPVRDAYVRSSDLAAEAEALWRAVSDVDDAVPLDMPQPLARCLMHVRVPVVYDGWQVDGGTAFGRIGSVEFYRGLAVAVPDPDQWWCPTIAEAVALGDQMTERRRIEALPR